MTGLMLSAGLGVGSASAAPLDVGVYLLPGGAVGTADIKILSSGGLSMNTFAPTTNVNGGIFSLVGNTLNIPNALPITLTAGAFELGTINVVQGGAGDITLFSGD